MADRAFAVKVVPKRLPVFPFSGLLKDCKGHKMHRFENGGTNQIRKTGNRRLFRSRFGRKEVVIPLEIWKEGNREVARGPLFS